jgi:periplasmic protein TonB
LGSIIQYPKYAKENNISGTVIITFIVEKDGSLTDVYVLKDIGGGCGSEGVRVINSMPNWIPGKMKGAPVRVQYNMPIRFTLTGGGHRGCFGLF